VSRYAANLLTISRFLMAIVFFVLLGLFDPKSERAWMLLDAATALFILAGVTDVIDGHLARTMGSVSQFGRVADPFVDKIIVCGAMIYFVAPPLAPVSGWHTWMVVAIIARELLVTGMRSTSESQGVAFTATWAGKLKMFLQCVAIVWSLVHASHWTALAPGAWQTVGRDIAIYIATFFTAASALVYIDRALRLLKGTPA
jgi:CDP-diacylglycerol--glycerol-3-phosphate 3-phosphatidyltransferase